MAETGKRLRLHGRVQGVSYRAWSRQTALALGLRGWVRNRTDGTVEMLIAGDPGRMAEMIDRCRAGPWAARVDRIDVEESDELPPTGFESRPTA